jgi:hypothetical protein
MSQERLLLLYMTVYHKLMGPFSAGETADRISADN